MSSGGGGSGGSAGVKYDNLEGLYGIQSQAAGFMLNQAMPRLPGTLDNSQAMVNEAMDGTLGMRARNRAGSDAQQAFGNNMAAVNRNTAKFGAEFNPNRMTAMQNNAAILGAENKVNAMNQASNWAEDQKWNRNAGYFAQVTGTGNGAMQGLSSAGSGMSNLANMQNQNAMANAQGYGQAGAAMAYGLFKADGGIVRSAHLANGGDAWEAYKAANPVRTSSSSSRGRGQNPVLGVLAGAAPMAVGRGLKEYGPKALSWAKGQMSGPATVQEAMNQGIDPYATYAGPTTDIANGMDYVNAGMAGTEAGVAGTEAGYAGSEAALSGTEVGVDTVGSNMDMAFFARGGLVKHGQHLAMGGLANPMAKSSMSSMDANMTMPSMSSTATTSVRLPSQAAIAAQEHQAYNNGRTTGMGEESQTDPDGFGSQGADNRHLAGKGAMYGVGRWLGGPLGGMAGSALAEVIHPVMEPFTRSLVRTGDQAGGVGGALIMDPQGTIASGKYSPDELHNGMEAVALGAPWAAKFLAEGGRVDHTDGGRVAGPGTETSDDIPAWLSDGEYVLNAEAVKLIGKDKLDQINQQGLRLRGQREEAVEGHPGVKDSPAEEKLEAKGMKPKRGKLKAKGMGGKLKLASGGDPVEEMLAKMKSKYGVSDKAAPEPAPQPQKPQTPQPPAPQPTLMDNLRKTATGDLEGRMRKAGAYACGGLVKKGRK